MRDVRTTTARRTATSGSLFVFLGLVGCSSAPAPALNAADWFTPASHVVLWDLYADAREAAGEQAAPLPAWIVARAASDLAAWPGADLAYREEHMLAGIERLGLLPDDVRARLVDADVEPLGWRAPPTWRIELERELAALPEAERVAWLESAVVANWGEAVANGDLRRLARIVETVDTHGLGALLPDDGRVAVHALLVAIEPTVDSMSIAPAAVALMERRGVPADLDLARWRKALRARIERLRDATIPLPHPYDLELARVRLERLTR